MTSTGGIVTSGTTNASGVVVLAHGAASGTISVTHPSGRFAAFSGSFSGCTGETSQTVTLNAASGYSCCWQATHPAPLRDSPYPVNAAALRITDPDGTQAFPVASPANPCAFQLCSGRSASNVGPVDYPVFTCFDTYWGTNRPRSVLPPIGPGTLNVRYAINFTAASLVLNQQHRWTGGPLIYHPDQDASGVPCIPENAPGWLAIAWRYPVACGSTTGFLANDNSVSVTVNSVLPLNLTFTFAAGTGYGPTPATQTGASWSYSPLTGNPYALSVVVSEP
jgi:hypothetical protein